ILGEQLPEYLLLVEGPDDEKIWRAWLTRKGYGPRVTIFRRGGMGAVSTARAIKAFARLGVSAPLAFMLVLDGSPGVPNLSAWLDPPEYYVCAEPDVTGYLLTDLSALGRGLGLADDLVRSSLEQTIGLPPKQRWAGLVREAGLED